LHDFRGERDSLPFSELLPIDRWALAKLGELIKEASLSYEFYEFHRAQRALLNFCACTLSAQYHDILKDRLYTLSAAGHERRSAQTAMEEILTALIAMLVPILTFTADEANAHRRCGEDFFETPAHLVPWPDASRFDCCCATASEMDGLFVLRTQVYKKLEDTRREGIIGKSLEASIAVTVGRSNPCHSAATKYADQLPELFIVSSVKIIEGEGDEIEIAVGRAAGDRCDRCWRHVSELENENSWRLCRRCCKVLLELAPNVA
jgi:isoleucyl-tRNA synthetase